MRTTDVYDVKRTGDLGGDRVAMKIDTNSIAHLMSVLTDLYSDSVMAVIREYSTNARDSHVEAGVTRPIEISLPNGMSPYFKVRDFGVGLSVDDITNIYSQYGASTKRDTDEQTGMLGLGCKSALTYTSQFTVVGIKNGVKATVLVSRVEDGTGVMEIVDTVSTTEHNGVEISVPVKNAGDFNAKTMRFFSFWEEGTVLVNGRQPDRINLDMVTDNIGIAASNILGSDVIVMGGVAYPCANRLFDGTRPYNDQFNIVAFVEIGDVHFVPSREALSYTKRTDYKVAEIKKTFTDNLVKKAQDSINAEVTHFAAWKRYTEWGNRIGTNITSGLTYNGLAFPSGFSFKASVYRSNYSRHQVQNYNSQNFGVETLNNALIIHDYDGVKLTARHKEKIRQYKANKGIVTNYHILTTLPEGKPWVDSSRYVTWADIKAQVLPSNGTSGARTGTIPVDVYNPTLDAFENITILDATKIACYISPTARLSRSASALLTTTFPGIQIVVLGENRWDKFKRENPTAKSLTSFIRDEVAVAESLLTSLDKKIISMSSWEKACLKNLDPNRIDDPEVKALIKIANGTTTSAAVDRYNTVLVASRKVGYYAKDFDSSNDSIAGAYPLLSRTDSDTMEHVIIYLNAVYQAKQNGTI
jgi:hypothetical protein